MNRVVLVRLSADRRNGSFGGGAVVGGGGIGDGVDVRVSSIITDMRPELAWSAAIVVVIFGCFRVLVLFYRVHVILNCRVMHTVLIFSNKI